jgi:hypothetical protein
MLHANQNWARICQLALRHRIPAMSKDAGCARRGLLVTYGQDNSWTVARAMDYVAIRYCVVPNQVTFPSSRHPNFS